MGFNYLEYGKFISVFKESLPFPLVLKAINAYAFPVPNESKHLGWVDLCLGLVWECNQGSELMMVSLKSPWTAMFMTLPEHNTLMVQTDTNIFQKNFGVLVPAFQRLQGLKLKSIEQKPKDRVLIFTFDDDEKSILEFEMISVRPNITIKTGHDIKTWKRQVTAKPQDYSSELLQKVRIRSEKAMNTAYSELNNEDFNLKVYLDQLSLRLQYILDKLLKCTNALFEEIKAQEIKAIGTIRKKRENSEKALLYLEYAELLKSHLYEYPKNTFLKKIKINEHVITLDENLNLTQNSEEYFRKYKRAQRSTQELELREVALAEQRKITDVAQRKWIEFTNNSLKGEASNEAESKCKHQHQLQLQLQLHLAIKFIKEDLPSYWSQIFKGLRNDEVIKKLNKREAKFKKSKLKSYYSIDGSPIWVGRSSEENEELVVRLANGNDVWLHLKSRPGAHAIIQLQRTKTASLETLIDAASLCAYYSDLKTGDQAEVDYTFRKYVKRIPGTKTFKVNYTQQKTLLIKLENKRLERLFQTHL